MSTERDPVSLTTTWLARAVSQVGAAVRGRIAP